MNESELNAEHKASFLRDLKSFLDDSKLQMDDFLSKIGWTEDDILQKEEMVVCPHNSGHMMPPKSLQKHVETCKMLTKGFTREELANEVPSSLFAYESSPAVVPVIIDRTTQTRILTEAFVTGQLQLAVALVLHGSDNLYPMRTISFSHAPPNYQPDKEVPLNPDRAIADLMTEERLAIYNYVVARGKESNRLATVDLEQLNVSFEKKQEPDKPKSHLEILAEQRDYKRRRQSYRAKNVHITKKSYTEIMREVINNQTEMLHEMVQDKMADEEATVSTDHDRPSRRKRERASSGSESEREPSRKRHRSRSRSSRKSRSHNDDNSHRHRHKKHHKRKKSSSRKRSRDKHRHEEKTE